MKHNQSTLHNPNNKLWITVLTAGICVALSVACLSTSGKKILHFQRAKVHEGKTFGWAYLDKDIGDGTFQSEATFDLSENLELAIVMDKDPSDEDWLGWQLRLIDRHKNLLIYESGQYSDKRWWLHEYKTKTHTFLLGEFETEFASILPLFVYSHESKQFAYAGEFEVELYAPEADCIPYPVKSIDISFSDTLTTFTFTKQLYLNESDTTYLVADSLMYELDLRSNSLRIAKIWGEKQVEVPK